MRAASAQAKFPLIKCFPGSMSPFTIIGLLYVYGEFRAHSFTHPTSNARIFHSFFHRRGMIPHGVYCAGFLKHVFRAEVPAVSAGFASFRDKVHCSLRNHEMVSVDRIPRDLILIHHRTNARETYNRHIVQNILNCQLIKGIPHPYAASFI